MAVISWGKPTIYVAPSGKKPGDNEFAFLKLSTPVEDSTELTGNQGDKTEATIEGGEAEATKFKAATFELAMKVRMALDTGDVYRYLPDVFYKVGDHNTPNHNEYTANNIAVVLIPEDEKAPGFFCPDCSVSIMETYTAADGAMWEITLGLNAVSTGELKKAVNFGQFYATAGESTNANKFKITAGVKSS